MLKLTSNNTKIIFLNKTVSLFLRGPEKNILKSTVQQALFDYQQRSYDSAANC
jgi:hypothetical protein